jgi:hypothetical protein
MKLRLVIFFIVSAFAVYSVWLYKCLEPLSGEPQIVYQASLEFSRSQRSTVYHGIRYSDGTRLVVVCTASVFCTEPDGWETEVINVHAPD